MTTAIKLENLGKKYFITHKKTNARYERFSDLLLRPFQKQRSASASQNQPEEFWALKNISLDIQAGDHIGIIGCNGAGKSTLLKILSRVTEPTTGRVAINGRLSSLLEVGTGFHFELTGRENIYLNGAILGMSHREIRTRFDAIVDFAEIEKFLDTPVKYYSSGMYVRLAFAVAAHLEPEILVVDEVLAVGDTAFQKKCLGKMQEVGGSGRTIIVVSHNMNIIDRLCSKGVWLNQGEVAFQGSASDTIRNYLNQNQLHPHWEATKNNLAKNQDRIITPLQLSLVDKNQQLLNFAFSRKTEAQILIKFYLHHLEPDICIGYSLMDENGQVIYRALHTDLAPDTIQLHQGENILMSSLPLEILNEGQHQLVFEASIFPRRWLSNPFTEKEAMIGFEIKGGLSDSPYWITKRLGIIAPSTSWKNI